MPVAVLLEQMPVSEFFDWAAYYRQEEEIKQGTAEGFEAMSPEQIGAYFGAK